MWGMRQYTRNLVFVFVALVASVVMAEDHVLHAPDPADRQTLFNTVTDFVATIGKAPEEAREIRQERRLERRESRLREERRRQRARMRNQIAQQQQIIMEKINAGGQ